MELSEFEKQRLAKIEKNREILKQLDIFESVPVPQAKKARTVPKKRSIPDEPVLPSRRSSRLAGVKEEPLLQLDQEEKAQERKEREVFDGDVSASFEESFTSLLEKAKESHQFDEEPVVNDVHFQKFMPSEAIKLTKERILSASWHPSSTYFLLCCGDKFGNMAITHFDTKQVFPFRPHSSGISNVFFSKIDPTKVFSSSYDGSVRMLDLKSQAFTQIFKDGEMITSLDVVEHNLYFGNNAGEVIFLDSRSPKNSTTYQVSERKVSCLHIHPSQPLMVTSGLDRTWKLWDSRSMKKPVFSYDHSKSCTSIYWNYDGSKLVSTSFDDTLGLFSFTSKGPAPIKKQTLIKHNNQTGRWVTNFRAVFHPFMDYLLVGNMARSVDVYDSVSGKIAAKLSDEDVVTAIPSVIAVHPTRGIIASLNASGKCVLWSDMDLEKRVDELNQRRN